MAEPFLGEIRAFGFNFAPRGWAECNGQLLPINQNQALFSLLGTMYGGDGRTTFALPDLRGRVSVGQGTGPGLTSYSPGERDGQETVALNQSQIPAHTHRFAASNATATQNSPADGVYAQPAVNPRMGTLYGAAPDATAGGTSPTGGSQPHENRQPHLAVMHAIALQGIFPSRN